MNMRRIKKVLILAAVLIFCIIGFIIGQIIYLSKPTQGNIITEYKNPKQAVLVIDIQEDFTGTTAKPPFPYKNSDRLISTANRITESASKKNMIIIYVKQELDGFMA